MAEITPKQKVVRLNKRGGKNYYQAYKTLIRKVSKEDKIKILNKANNCPVSQAFVKSVIAMAEQDDN